MSDDTPARGRPTRRQAFQLLAGLGIGTATFQRALAAQTDRPGPVTAEMVQQAEWVAGIKLRDEDRKAIAGALTGMQRDLQALRKVKLDQGAPPAVLFQPASWREPSSAVRGVAVPPDVPEIKRPDKPDDLAFLTVTQLSALLRSRQVSTVELTRLYLERLKKYDPILKCVVTFTDDLAMKQAEQADREIAAGHYRGPLHGIPWGAKDLIAYPGYKTTWGAGHFKDQKLNVKATVAKRLEDAGAVMVAKLTLGALAQGDRWFGGMTRNPWNPKIGSSGSSAGSAATTAAGLVGFAIGSETLGSIVSPCSRCGATGLRPTFGRVSRHGCMTLAWSMDKLGPIARSVADCALIFGAIHGRDGLDPCAVDRPFNWPPRKGVKGMRVGYVKNSTPAEKRDDLKVLRGLGVELVPIELPTKAPLGALRHILTAECAAAFDEVVCQGVTEGLGLWLHTFQEGEFITAVEYLRANQLRYQRMREMEEVMAKVEAFVGGFFDLLLTNMTGHPTVVMPNGFRKSGGRDLPTAITFTGRLYGETELLALGQAYQEATGHHLRHPAMEKLTPEAAGDE